MRMSHIKVEADIIYNNILGGWTNWGGDYAYVTYWGGSWYNI